MNNVKRNPTAATPALMLPRIERFPGDFMFALTSTEKAEGVTTWDPLH
jgi:hypothetical protein